MKPQREDYLHAVVRYTNASLKVGDAYVMHEWERPLIQKMVNDLRLTREDTVLEVGYGMGISATMIQVFEPERHTLVEPHPVIMKKAEQWRNGRENIELVSRYWQQLDLGNKRYSAIFFDPYGDSIEAVIEENLEFIGFASRFLLAENGRLALFCIHPTLDEFYQDYIAHYFRRVELSYVAVAPKETDDPTVYSDGRMISLILHK